MADTHSTYIGVIQRGEQSPTLETIGKKSQGIRHAEDLGSSLYI